MYVAGKEIEEEISGNGHIAEGVAVEEHAVVGSVVVLALSKVNTASLDIASS